MTRASGTEDVFALPPGTREVAAGLYAGRTDIRRLLLPEGLERIGEEAFSGCERLEELTLPATLADTGVAAFSECARLRRVALPEGLASIAPGTFLNCTALRSLALPQTLRRIGAMAFWGAGLEELDVPENVEEIGENAFWDCTALRRVNVPNAAARLGRGVFGECAALREGYIAPGCPESADGADELLYALLWCSCPERHGAAVSARAEAYIRANEALVMEKVLAGDNAAALSGLIRRALLREENLGGYVRGALQRNERELTALLLAAGRAREELEL